MIECDRTMNGRRRENGNHLSARKKSKRLPFLVVILLGLLLLRIRNFQSFERYENEHALELSTHKNEDTRESGAFSDIMPHDWHQWLEKYSNEIDREITIHKMQPTSVHADWGCGISMQLQFQTSALESIPATIKAFFKASYADMLHFDAESHLREIKAFYLDRILKTNVVLPCVGYHLDREKIPNDKKWAFIQKNIQCINEKSDQADVPSDHRTATVEGSIMLWMNGLSKVEKEQIVGIARLSEHDVARSQELQEEQESAMNYAIFHYLGACMKSEHNHFSYRMKKSRFYVAIDNDRCMTPKSIFSNREVVPDLHFNRIQLWEKLVFERICQVSHSRYPVLKVVKEAADPTKSGLVSNSLQKALETDVLSHELARSQPEAFLEIDERIGKLDEYIQKNCPQEAL